MIPTRSSLRLPDWLCSAGDHWVINTAVERLHTSPSLASASVFCPWLLDGDRNRHIDRKGLEGGKQSIGARRRVESNEKKNKWCHGPHQTRLELVFLRWAHCFTPKCNHFCKKRAADFRTWQKYILIQSTGFSQRGQEHSCRSQKWINYKSQKSNETTG